MPAASAAWPKLFERAIDQAAERGWALEEAIARIQFAEVSPVLGLARPDTCNAEVLLQNLGISPERVALTAARAALVSQRTSVLSDRESEVLELIGQGLTIKKVARKLGIRESTVKTYVDRGKMKLGTEGLTGARATALVARVRRKV